MKFTLLLASLLSTAIVALPTDTDSTPPPAPYVACPDTLFPSEQCCATDVLGVADLDCQNPSEVPESAEAFQEGCAAGGQRARCCLLPILGQGIVCTTPLGL